MTISWNLDLQVVTLSLTPPGLGSRPFWAYQHLPISMRKNNIVALILPQDFTLLNISDFYMRKANALEKIRHELHMHEIWAGAATHYKDFIQNPPSCDCLQDDLVIFYLKDRASFIRDERRDGRSYIVEVGNETSWIKGPFIAQLKIESKIEESMSQKLI